MEHKGRLRLHDIEKLSGLFGKSIESIAAIQNEFNLKDLSGRTHPQIKRIWMKDRKTYKNASLVSSTTSALAIFSCANKRVAFMYKTL
jgi:hypothetical protein